MFPRCLPRMVCEIELPLSSRFHASFLQRTNVRHVLELCDYLPDVFTVEKAKSALPVRPDQRYNVDFLTEATKLLSAAWYKGEDMSAVKMKTNRQEKVSTERDRAINFG